MNKKVYEICKAEKFKTKRSSPAEFGSARNTNEAKIKLFDEYFTDLIKNKKLREQDGIEVKYLLNNGHIMASDTPSISSRCMSIDGMSIILSFKGYDYSVKFFTRTSNNKLTFHIWIGSKEESLYGPSFILKYLMYCAILNSDLKGSHLVFKAGDATWTVTDLEERTFNDIFLPQNITEDLELYTEVFDKDGVVLRYLLVGNPGTGKTEASLVLANELNKQGVTVIKTAIDSSFNYKMDLAKLLAPSIVILDDLDISLGGRDSGGFSQLLGPFLDVLDGTDKLPKDVGILATTNAAKLLDLAAQRPGRFNRTLLFDNLTKDNIRAIILKSLRNEFNIKKLNKTTEMFVSDIIVDKFYTAGYTGSHVYNTIKMLKLRYETFNRKFTISELIKDIDNEIEVAKRIKNESFLNDKLNRRDSGSGIGFSFNEDLIEGEDY